MPDIVPAPSTDIQPESTPYMAFAIPGAVIDAVIREGSMETLATMILITRIATTVYPAHVTCDGLAESVRGRSGWGTDDLAGALVWLHKSGFIEIHADGHITLKHNRRIARPS